MSLSKLPKSLLRCRGRTRPRWQRLATYWLWRLGRQQERPEVIARGVAVGMFAGVLPMLGQSFVAIALAWAVRGSKIVAAAMTFVSNPLTTFPIFLFDYWLGSLILGREMLSVKPSDFESWERFSALGTSFVFTIFLGGIITGAVVGAVSYFLGHALVKHIQSERRNRPRLRTATSVADRASSSDRVS